MDSDMFTELESSATKFNELSDSIDHSINQKIREVEERLVSMRIEFKVLLEEPLKATNGSCYRLGYGEDLHPHGRGEYIGWHLLIKHSHVQNPDGELVADDEASDRERLVAISPLLEVSRDLRILALQRIPELLKTLKIKVDRRIQALRIASASLGQPKSGGNAAA